jgi:hypothetical protein
MKEIHSESQGEPYHYGDVHDIAWSPVRLEGKLKGKWNKPFPIPSPVDAEKAQGVLGKKVHIGGADPFAWLDRKYKTGHQALLDHQGKSLDIHTRSDLIGHNDYMNALDKDNHRIYIHLNENNDEIEKYLAPGAPSVSRRLKTAKKLKDAGYNVKLVQTLLKHPQTGEYLNEKINPFNIGMDVDIKYLEHELHPHQYSQIKHLYSDKLGKKEQDKELKLGIKIEEEHKNNT